VKHLPKHLQPRWRYLAVGVETQPDTRVGRDRFQQAVWAAARSLLGDTGSGALDLSVVRFHTGHGVAEAVVRTYRGELERARAALACVDRVDGDPVGVWVRGVSGTVRACEERYMGARREQENERTVVFESAERPAVVHGKRVDVRVDGEFVGATTLDT